MPSCVVKSCRNNTLRSKKSQGITFHRFSKQNKSDWVEIIRHSRGENEWNPSSSSVICSSHFDEQDMLTTKNGLRRIVASAVPKKLLFNIPNSHEERPAEPNISSGLQWTQLIEIVETNIKKDSSLERSESPNTTIELLQTQPMEIEVTNFKKESLLEGSESPSTTIGLLQTDPIKIEVTNFEKESFLERSESPSSTIGLRQTQPIEIVVTNIKKDSSLEWPESPSTTLGLLQTEPIEIAETYGEQLSSLELPESPSITIPLSQIPPYTEAVPTTFKQTDLFDSYVINKQKLSIKKYKSKIKVLNQKIRRLQNKNKSLKDMVKKLKKQNYVDTDLFNTLNENIGVADVFHNQNIKKQKKIITYSPAIKKFCLTLNSYSPKAFEYVRQTFNTYLPHPKTLAKWNGQEATQEAKDLKEPFKD